MADRKSRSGDRKKGARKIGGRKTSARKVAVSKADRSEVAAKKKPTAKVAKKTVSAKKKSVTAKTAKPVRAAAARSKGSPKVSRRNSPKKTPKTSPRNLPKSSAKISPLPPLPPPLAAQPKKLSRSSVRRAVAASTAAQRNAAAQSPVEACSEADLREKMRLASAYIDTWFNRRLVFAAEVTGPEDAWAQIWLWLKHMTPLEDGRILTQDLFEALYADEMTQLR